MQTKPTPHPELPNTGYVEIKYFDPPRQQTTNPQNNNYTPQSPWVIVSTVIGIICVIFAIGLLGQAAMSNNRAKAEELEAARQEAITARDAQYNQCFTKIQGKN